MRISQRSEAASNGPGRTAIRPTSIPGRLWSAKTASHGNLSNSPSSTMTRPPPPPSSAGWKIRCTVPSKFRVVARYLAAPSSIRRVPVVAAGVHAAVMGRAVGEIVQLLDRQRVHIGAQPNRTGRIAVANGADYPGAGEPAVYLAPELGQPGRDEVSGALLGKSELRMGMNIASDRSQLVVIVEHLGKDRHVPLFARRPARQSGTIIVSPMSAMASTG